MNYSDGEIVLLGDKVSFGGGINGFVVGVIDTREFSKGYLQDEWLYLTTGALVESAEAGLVHYPDFSDVALIERSKKS